MRTQILAALIVISLLLTGCVEEPAPIPTRTPPPPTPIPSPTSGISPEAQAYLDEVIDIVRSHAINREMVNYEVFQGQVSVREMEAVTPRDTYDSVIYLLGQLKDGHSRFLTPEEAEWFQDLETASPENPEPIGGIRDGVAYLHISQFASGDLQVNQAYANTLFDLVMALDAQSPCGWVIDLRDNYGGNLAPMVSGMVPLIGDGVLGYFEDVEGNRTPIEYDSGEFIGDDENDWFDTGYRDISLQHPNPPIAILIGPNTASSGEMLALTFKGKENVIYFGHQTAGQTTGNDKFDLSDGAILLLTTAVFVDREGTVYGGPVLPDLPLESVSGYSGEIPPEVSAWLSKQPSCQVSE
ncbi:MAG: S41 family peptidase [Anaerolineales bacterium]